MTAAAQSAAVSHSDVIEQPVIAREVLAGLAREPKQISPKFFYDQKGSELFDSITALDEYYVPRVEKSIFEQHVAEMCSVIGEGAALVEPGAGSCEKIKWLLPELAPSVYVPMDISAEHLHASAQDISDRYPGLEVRPQACDHTAGLDIEVDLGSGAPVFFYPGSSIGNYEPAAAVEFLQRMRAVMSADGGLLIGVDTKKDPDVLHAAYNDAEGVTAQFNINVLDHLNTLLDGNLDSDQFVHHALYNEAVGRIEMHLRCTESHTAELAGETLEFTEGELIHTENSYKYHPTEFEQLATEAGFAQRALWQDPKGWFSVFYFEPV